MLVVNSLVLLLRIEFVVSIVCWHTPRGRCVQFRPKPTLFTAYFVRLARPAIQLQMVPLMLSLSFLKFLYYIISILYCMFRKPLPLLTAVNLSPDTILFSSRSTFAQALSLGYICSSSLSYSCSLYLLVLRAGITQARYIFIRSFKLIEKLIIYTF